MKAIGFIDHFLDERHANQYPAWIRESEFGGEIEVKYAWAETENPQGSSNQDWCRKENVRWCDSIEETISKSDYLVILSPDHPERHEALSRLALLSGKPTYIDKTFASNLATARRIMRAAQDGKTPMFSSSALRFSRELAALRECAESKEIALLSTTGGNHFESYAIHQIEMHVALRKQSAVRVKQCGHKEAPHLLIDFGKDSLSCIQLLRGSPFRISAVFKEDGFFHSEEFEPDFFQCFIHEMLTFFKTGMPPFSHDETLFCVAILESSRLAIQSPGQWIPVEKV